MPESIRKIDQIRIRAMYITRNDDQWCHIGEADKRTVHAAQWQCLINVSCGYINDKAI